MASIPSVPLASIQHWSRIRISLLWIYRGEVPPGVSGFMDRFLVSTAWLVLRGSAETSGGGRVQRAQAGEWLFPRPVARHQKFSPGTEILSLRFRLEWPNGEQLFGRGLPLKLKSSAYPELERAARKMERATHSITRLRFRDASLADKEINFLQYLELEKAVHLWTGAVYRALTQAGLSPVLQQAGDPRIQAVLECLDDWPLPEPFQVVEVARRCGMSRSNLERVVARALGTSAKTYFDRRRIEHALQCLKAEVPVKQIGIEVGFRHASSFCAWFRHRTGSYPGEMRRRFF